MTVTEQEKASIKENIELLLSQVQENKTAENVTVMLATKTVSTEKIAYAVNECGINAIGENKVQELLEKYEQIKDLPCQIHFIGTLQTNKVKYIVGKVSLIHSVDSDSLLKEINKRAEKLGIIQDILIEVNSGREENKGGVMPENTEAFLEKALQYDNIRVKGIMTMAPKCENKSDYHNYFSQIYKLFIDICKKTLDNVNSPILSMGMSDSYVQALQNGSTMIRVGSAVFGKRNYNNN